MATKSVITKIRRKKMAEASHTTGKIAKITHIALGLRWSGWEWKCHCAAPGECAVEK